MFRWSLLALVLALVAAVPAAAQRAGSQSSRLGADASPSPAGPGPAVRPMTEMHGGCRDYASDVQAALAALRGPRTRVLASRAPRAPRATLEVGRAYQVHLRPAARVEYLEDPGRGWGQGGRAGLVEFHPPRAGAYRVSLSRKLWIDAVQEGATVPTHAFEMQTGCADLFKSVVYVLGEAPVVLQLGGRGGDQVGLVVTADEARRP